MNQCLLKRVALVTDFAQHPLCLLYTSLVTDPEEQDIREMLPRQGMGPPQILPASFHQ